MKYLAILSMFFLSACMTNQALENDPKPTKLGGFWSASHVGVAMHWFIRPDGTGVQCESRTISTGQPTISELTIVGESAAYSINKYTLIPINETHFNADTWGGAFTLKFSKKDRAPAACAAYFVG